MSSAKWLSVFFLILVMVTLVAQGQVRLAGNTYLEKQLLCALDRAPCDTLGKQIKDALPEIIGRGCQRCDRRQINNARRMANFVQQKYPDVWEELKRKYSA